MNGYDDESDIAFHFNPRQDDGQVVLNNRFDGSWQEEERHDLPQVLVDKAPFEIKFIVKSKKFKVLYMFYLQHLIWKWFNWKHKKLVFIISLEKGNGLAVLTKMRRRLFWNVLSEFVLCCITLMGAQWLSGRVLDSRQKDCVRVWASPASLPCVLEQDTLILA